MVRGSMSGAAGQRSICSRPFDSHVVNRALCGPYSTDGSSKTTDDPEESDPEGAPSR